MTRNLLQCPNQSSVASRLAMSSLVWRGHGVHGCGWLSPVKPARSGTYSKSTVTVSSKA